MALNNFFESSIHQLLKGQTSLCQREADRCRCEESFGEGHVPQSG